ncbi:hypothetical protein ACFSSF_10420 [Dietzia aerolata]|uniref:hypothetical protein n=1 Tax=Dietzia aerolata TaxID=595984 RepID=UPI003625C218
MLESVVDVTALLGHTGGQRVQLQQGARGEAPQHGCPQEWGVVEDLRGPGDRSSRASPDSWARSSADVTTAWSGRPRSRGDESCQGAQGDRGQHHGGGFQDAPVGGVHVGQQGGGLPLDGGGQRRYGEG